MKLLVIDVDGTLTDGKIIYDEAGNELKAFSVRDAAGFFAAKAAGIQIMVLTGRECKATKRRLEELKADFIFQNVKDKSDFLHDFCENHSLKRNDLGYIGDDLNDLAAMRICGFAACPSDACAEVRELADYVSEVKGGYGVVRDVIESYLRDKGIWSDLVKKVYPGAGV